MNKNSPLIPQHFMLLILTILLTACVNTSATDQPILPATLPANLKASPMASDVMAEAAPTSTQVPTVTATPSPPAVYLSNPLPEGIIQLNNSLIPLISDNRDAPFWFGLADQAPEGEVIQTAQWTFALTAPFPTITDAVSLSVLKAYWQGEPQTVMDSLATLYIPQALVEILDSRWGVHASESITIFQTTIDPDQIWEENAWAIIPFERLEPKLKVISVDGISPLAKDIDLKNDPLTFSFNLVKRPSPNRIFSDDEVRPMLDAIQTTNRYPQKMTTLIMTGVTALVRATAYKMEVNGVLYPGEQIVEWLSEADLTHISNEVSFYEECPFPDPNSRWLLFCSNPDYFELFKFIGADIIELTGNHNNDVLFVYGEDVVPYNIDLYLQAGMTYYGGGLNLEDATSSRVISHNGNLLAFIGCNASGPNYAWATEDQGGAANCGDFAWMADEISRLKSEGFIPIATLQYYEDYYNFPAEHHIRDFGTLAEAGAVIVNGSQAHRPKGMAFSSDAFIDYGLGNLFFDQMGVLDSYGNQILQTRWEIIQRHTFYEGRHLSTELLTAMLEDYAQPRPMTVQERTIFLEEIFEASGWISR